MKKSGKRETKDKLTKNKGHRNTYREKTISLAWTEISDESLKI